MDVELKETASDVYGQTCEAPGVDPSAPDVRGDDDRHHQVQTGRPRQDECSLALRPNWDGGRWAYAGDDGTPAVADLLLEIRDAFERPSADEPPKQPEAALMPVRKVREKLAPGEANSRVKEYLDNHATATIKEVSKAIGISVGCVHGCLAWEEKMADRRANKPPPKKRTVRLWKKTSDALVGRDGDPAAKLILDEDVWAWIVEQEQQPARKKELLLMSEERKMELIEFSREQYEADPRDFDDD